MKIILIFVIFSLNCAAFSQTRSFEGKGQTEMNLNAAKEYDAYKYKLQLVVKEIITKNKSDTLFVENFKKSQTAWEKWSNSEIETFFPNYNDSKEFYGSMQPICRYSKLIDWLEERINFLKKNYLKDFKYDLCAPGRN